MDEFADGNAILRYLQAKEKENPSIVNFAENYPVTCAEKIGGSVLIKGSSDHDWVYIYGGSEEELESIDCMLGADDRYFAAIESWMIPFLSDGKRVKWVLSAMRLILPEDVVLPEPAHEISELTPGDAAFVYENSGYKEYLSVEYVHERIKNGMNSCIREAGRPVGWAITQDDGAIGFLHVLPECRRKGYARDVTVDLINKARAKGKIPFAHIEEDNSRSMNLATGLGFKEDRIVNWFELYYG